MKRLFIKIIVIVIPIFILNILYKNTNYFLSENYVSRFDSVPEKIKLANMGGSQEMFGLCYKNHPEIKCFNFANTSQDFFWDYGVLSQFIDKMDNESVLIIGIPYCYVRGIQSSEDIRPRYYRFLKKEYFDEWKFTDKIKYGFFPIFSAGTNLYHIVKDVSYDKIDWWTDLRTAMSNEDEILYCEKLYDGWTKLDYESGKGGYLYNLNNVKKVVELCLNNNVKPVLISCPVIDKLNILYENYESFFDDFYSFSESICEEYSIPFFDYSHDVRFQTRYDLFYNGNHLNEKGALFFTDILLKDLIETGYLIY